MQAEEVFPAGCEPLVVRNNQIELPTAVKSSIIMLHNLSTTDLWVTYSAIEHSVATKASQHLTTGNWSAFALKKESFAFNCIESRPGHEQQIACVDVLAVCQWPHGKGPEKTSFLIAENMSLSSLIAYIGRKGFVLGASSVPLS